MDVCMVCGAPLSGRKQLYCSAKCRDDAKRERLRQSYKPAGNPGLYRTKTCPDCGMEFVGHIKSYRCRECQQVANRKADVEAKRRQAAGKTRALGSIDICQRCGAPYTVEGGRQKYCPDCATAADREYHAKRMQEIYEARPDLKQARAVRRAMQTSMRECVVCGNAFGTKAFALTCSPECRSLHRQAYMTKYDAARKDQHLAYNRARWEKLTLEEKAEINRKAREAYARRKKQDEC